MTNENLNQSEYDVQTTTDGTSVENTDGTNNTPLLDVDGSVKTNHIEDGAVTAEKLSSDVLTDSYIDITESLRSGFKNGFYNVEYTSGILNISDNAIATDFIKCKPNDKFRVSGYSTGHLSLVFYFDSNKLPLIDENETSSQAHYDAYSETGEFFTSYEITIPENCCYVVFQSYTPGILKVESLVKQVVEKIATISYWKKYDDSDFEASARHQYTEATKLNKLSIDSWKTLKIPCKPGDKFIVSGFIPASITATAVAIFVDKDNKNPEYIGKGISGESVTTFYKIITAPENTAFVAFNSYCSKTNGVITSGRELYVSKYVTELKTEANSNKIMNTSINPLCGKKIFVDGDSIAQGSDGISYADIIAQRNNMQLTKTAVGGTALAKNDAVNTKYGNNHFSICERVRNLRPDQNDSHKYDYILLEGGYNDVFNSNKKDDDDPKEQLKQVYLGSLSDGYDKNFSDNDIVTTIAATEAMCKHLVTYYFDTPKLFVLGHRKIGYVSTQNNYWDGIKSALEKWGIPYVDLRHESNLMLVDGLTEKYFCNGDGTHPTKEAYDIFYVPAIEAKLKSL